MGDGLLTRSGGFFAFSKSTTMPRRSLTGRRSTIRRLRPCCIVGQMVISECCWFLVDLCVCSCCDSRFWPIFIVHFWVKGKNLDNYRLFTSVFVLFSIISKVRRLPATWRALSVSTVIFQTTPPKLVSFFSQNFS